MKRTTVQRIKRQFAPGTRVRLIEMDDIKAPPIGTEGIVNYVDDIGTIHVAWDNGSSLGIVYGVDRCVIIE